MSRPSETTRNRLSRRQFLGVGVAGVASAGAAQSRQMGDVEAMVADLERRLEADNVYTRLLGVRPHLPGHGTGTRLGGCRMPAEVVAAMQEANDYFVQMDELQVAAGRRAAEVVKAEAAVITSGGTGALMLGAAACLTGTDTEKMRALPHPTWARRECIIQKAHRYMYDRALRSAGVTFVEVEGREQLMNALGESTALLFGLPRGSAATGVVPPEGLIEIGRRAGVPVMIDGASRLPPEGNLTVFNELGADLVALSGGKGLRGPQSTGILSGRADLIEAARLQAAPNDQIGRGMKVGKEEIIGLVVALNRYAALDHAAVRRAWRAKADYVAAQLQDVPGLVAVVRGSGDAAPFVELTWDRRVVPLSEREVRNALERRGRRRVGIPMAPVEMRALAGPPEPGDGSGPVGVNHIQTRSMRDGEEVLVARYLRTFFTEEAAAL